MSPFAVEKPDWAHIDTVLLDLDGTLLDLAYDNHFWLEIVPAAYAAARLTTVEAARVEIAPLFRACEGTLPWYCIDHWSRELDLDIEALKRANTERIAWLPGARDFLLRLRDAGKRVVLLTNSHPQVLRIAREARIECPPEQTHLNLARHLRAVRIVAPQRLPRCHPHGIEIVPELISTAQSLRCANFVRSLQEKTLVVIEHGAAGEQSEAQCDESKTHGPPVVNVGSSHL